MKSPRRTEQKISPSDLLSREEAQEIVDAIVRARKRAGLTQADIAQAMGITQSSVARLESSATLPRLSTLQRFARATSSRIHLSIDPVSNHDIRTASHTMTDMLTRPGHSTDRRRFLGGAVGLAGMLGLSKVKHVTAQEATAAAESADDYVWQQPDWHNIPKLFEVLEHHGESALVRTGDGEFEIPTNPQRLVCLNSEYTTLIPLGLTSGYFGVDVHWGTGEPSASGEFSDDIQSILADVHRISTPWELNVEEVIALEPDLVLGRTGWQTDQNYDAISPIAPMVRFGPSAYYYPRQGLKDYGELFTLSDRADKLIAGFDALIDRARKALEPFVQNVKVAVMEFDGGTELYAFVSYFVSFGGLFGEDGRVLPTGDTQTFFKELCLTPSSFIEKLGDDIGRDQAFYVNFSMEQIGLVDADYIFVIGKADITDAFINESIVKSTVAGKAGQVIPLDVASFGFGLGAQRAEVRAIVEAITGEPFA
ncbi:MAG: ABC transporter substrate-binding protein [Thermomicrobiales bacterium]|nr:ABC transporter substrate-binding protein [Thermomicrobiales bacterium]